MGEKLGHGHLGVFILFTLLHLSQKEFQRMQDTFTAQYRELQMQLDKNMEQTFTILKALWNGQRRSIYTETETQKRYKRQAEDLQTEIEELNRKVSSESSTSVSVMVRLNSSSK